MITIQHRDVRASALYRWNAVLLLCLGCSTSGPSPAGSGGSPPNANGGLNGSSGAATSNGGMIGNGGTASGGETGSGASGGNSGNGAGGSGGVGVTPSTPVVVSVAGGQLEVEVCSDSIIHVVFAKNPSFFTHSTLATAVKHCAGAAWTRTDSTTETVVATPKLRAHIDLATGVVSFHDAADTAILSEKSGGGRTLTTATVQGQPTTNVRQEWEPNADESLYGLGQHQQGLVDIKGYDLDFHQYNTEVFVPYLVSSRGYGILWDNTSFTRFGDLRQPVPVPGPTYDASGNITATAQGTVNFQGSVSAPAAGDYLFYTYSSGNIQLDLNGQRVVDHFRQGWLPSTDVVKVALTAGQAVPVRLQWASDIGVNIVNMRWKTPTAAPTTSLWSEVGDGVDYYFVYGPELDDVIAGYRALTGPAPMIPKWALGFWQSRDHYLTQQESLDVLAGYRTRGAPIDNIVQDWQYWPAAGWGSHQFDATRFPDTQAWIDAIHNTYHAHLMVSVWAKFYTGTANFTALNQGGFLYQPNLTLGLLDFQDYAYTYYDAFSSGGRQLYWSQVKTALFDKGVDAWWADATEPDINEDVPSKNTAATHLEAVRTQMNPTALGTASSVLNAYSLYHASGVYAGQRAAAPNQRVFILTRSGFAGQQRFATTTWSGDITSTWTAMKKQIAAGLGLSVSGLPYWTMDVGGYVPPTRFLAGGAEWQELNARWFEFGTFAPLLRVHGQAPPREMWQFGGNTSATYLAELKFDKLRYRLMPYIYSLAGAVTHASGTILRPLVMDFRSDTAARKITDQFMFGPALLVNPVTTYQARTRSVYLPVAPAWYDFWTGARSAGGQTLAAAPAAFDSIPVYARAGSIIPLGPDLQYVAEKPADPITLYVYTGADGAFTLYEDDGLSYAYETGAFANIPITWNDASRTLTLGARQGSFAGMLAERSFQVVLVSAAQPVGYAAAPPIAQTLTYSGASVSATF